MGAQRDLQTHRNPNKACWWMSSYQQPLQPSPLSHNPGLWVGPEESVAQPSNGGRGKGSEGERLLSKGALRV